MGIGTGVLFIGIGVLIIMAFGGYTFHWSPAVSTGVHLANPNATLLSAAAIAIEAGLLLGAAFLWRRNLWFVTGLHFAWNSCVSLLGIPVSGY